MYKNAVVQWWGKEDRAVETSRLLAITGFGVGQILGRSGSRQTKSIAHLFTHVGITRSFVVGYSLDTGRALRHLVSRRQLSVLNVKHVSRVLFGFH